MEDSDDMGPIRYNPPQLGTTNPLHLRLHNISIGSKCPSHQASSQTTPPSLRIFVCSKTYEQQPKRHLPITTLGSMSAHLTPPTPQCRLARCNPIPTFNVHPAPKHLEQIPRPQHILSREPYHNINILFQQVLPVFHLETDSHLFRDIRRPAILAHSTHH